MNRKRIAVFAACVFLGFGATSGRAEKTETKLHGWAITVDDAASDNAAINRKLLENRAPGYLENTFVTLRRDEGEMARDDKIALLEKLQRYLAVRFTRNGFDLVSEEELSRHGVDMAAARAKAMEGMPFGFRNRQRDAMGEKITVLHNDTDAPCVNGYLLAFIFTMKPQVNVASDYGSIIYSILDVEQCPMDVAAAKQFIHDTEENVQAALIHRIGEEK